MADLSIEINGLNLLNPIMTASGTFGYGEEFQDFIDLSQLGGYIVKGTTLNHREGNDYPRMAETASGMLNAVGLQNKGVDYFINNIYPLIKDTNPNILVNVSGATIEEYIAVAEKINELENIPGIELNISCPNVKEGGLAFGTDCLSVKNVVEAVRKVYKKHLMVKLSPNVTSITDIAMATEDAGADSISLINTLLGMAVDAKTRKPILSTITGGLSGPCIKPVALRMVWQVSKVVKIPLVGIGGIVSVEDAVEFLLVGASAIQIGVGNFIDPALTIKVINGLNKYLDDNNFSSIKEIIGLI